MLDAAEQAMGTADVSSLALRGRKWLVVSGRRRADGRRTLQLYTQLVDRRIEVDRFAGIHWGVSTWKDLLVMVGKSGN